MDSNDPLRTLPLVTEPQNKRRRAASWQIALTTLGVLAIVAIFFFGINHQRNETADQQTAGTTPTPITPQGGDTQKAQDQQQAGQRQQAPSTTGQGGSDDKSNDKNDRPQTGGQKPGGQPVDSNGEPAQRQSK